MITVTEQNREAITIVYGYYLCEFSGTGRGKKITSRINLWFGLVVDCFLGEFC